MWNLKNKEMHEYNQIETDSQKQRIKLSTGEREGGKWKDQDRRLIKEINKNVLQAQGMQPILFKFEME